MRRVRLARVAQAQHAGIDEQAAVAVFRQARQPVDVGHLDARPCSGSISE